MADGQHLTSLKKVTYLGSHPASAGQLDDLTLDFYSDRLDFRCGRKLLGDLRWSDATSMFADTQENVERRVTATRLVLLGAFALLARKERMVSYLVVTDKHGDWIFAIPGLSAIELRAGLAPMRARVGIPEQSPEQAASPAAPAAPSTVAERLRSLQTLLDDGLISPKEFASQRQAIISQI